MLGSPSSPWPPPWSAPWPAGNWRHEDQYEQIFINTLGAWMERILSNDTETKSEVSQGKMLLSIPSISHHEPTIWLLQCCRFPTCCCKLQNVWTEHYWMRTKGECGFAELGADPAMISNWNRSILNSAIDWVITYRKDCTSSCQLYSLINKIRFGAFYQCLWFLALTTLLNFVIIAYDLY